VRPPTDSSRRGEALAALRGKLIGRVAYRRRYALTSDISKATPTENGKSADLFDSGLLCIINMFKLSI
jgi:hypothetical protein